MEFSGKHAVITGASSGIGRAIALELAQRGAHLHLVGRDPTRLEQVAEAARAAGGTARVYRADLAEDAALEALARDLAALERVDVLVHSAGVVALGPVATAPVEKLDWQYRVNLRAPFALTQALLPALERARGQVVFINSGAGLRANAGWSQYAATKHGLKALADALRAEVAPRGVRVISVYPGRTATPMQAEVHRAEGRAYHPERFVQPEDVALEVLAALSLPARAVVTDLSIRPAVG
ncbi:SDR family oxidoreductase [Marinithermus hydrothermalis]|uniref:3-oxoacyl-(Acyl-carrier-protein) reductase n=1 Tax=Marinithermus hydrothermalis (strain DSM 14884 / JCM 11576 / T1) TaxID=869210 RepID=F2NNS5_MARHT|nr:SDR family oxidoreductase [Marinithermus hydrothermalis]AEB11299.1 3-oxoacyl-(acyl-carrier-protein) reductase [Marinithermus hydrothermalis DSM 14884]